MSDKVEKIAENGARGESRTEALLIERFWVLRRSIDIQGADFLIQIADSSRRFTDPQPPRLGVVQSKFYQDKKTTHYIHKNYVLDEITNKPLVGFFALLHVGPSDKKKRYLLSAEDIVKNLDFNQEKKSFVLGKKAISAEFRAKKDSTTLDKIEKILKLRNDEDTQNFSRKVSIPDFDLTRRNLDTEWLLPIPNNYLFIPDEIYLIKLSLRTALYHSDDILQKIGDFLVETNPENCLTSLEKIKGNLDKNEIDGTFHIQEYPGHLRLETQDLEKAIKQHQRRCQLLKVSPDLWKEFIRLHANVSKVCWEQFHYENQATKSTSSSSFQYVPTPCEITVSWDPKTFGVKDIKINTGKRSAKSTKANELRIRGDIFTDDEGSRLVGVRDMHQLIVKCMAAYYQVLVPTEKIGKIKLPMLLMT